MSRRRRFKERTFGVREWMGNGWWAALGLSLLTIVAIRLGTVTAPGEETTPSLESQRLAADHVAPRSPRNAALERDLRATARELELTRDALAAEKERVALLQESYDGLNDQFSQVTSLVQSAAVSASYSKDEQVPVPAPVEAIFVRRETPSAKASESQ